MQVLRARQMALAIAALSGRHVGEVEAGVQNHQRLDAARQCEQLLGRDEGRVRHAHDSGVVATALAGVPLRHMMAARPALTISPMPASAIQVTRSSNSNTP